MRALNQEASFVVFLLHQARDRFRYLIGLSEYRRRLLSEISFAVRSLAVAEGGVGPSGGGDCGDERRPRDSVACGGAEFATLPILAEAVAGRYPAGWTRKPPAHTRRGRWMMPLLARRRPRHLSARSPDPPSLPTFTSGGAPMPAGPTCGGSWQRGWPSRCGAGARPRPIVEVEAYLERLRPPPTVMTSPVI